MILKAQTNRFRLALLSLLACGFLALLVVASFGASWGVAYGQTVPGGVVLGDPVISKTSDPSAAGAGAPVLFTITVNNPGATDATNIIVTDNVPEQFAISSASSSRGQTSVDGQVVTLKLDRVAPGETVTIRVNTTVRPGANIPDASVINKAVLSSSVGTRSTEAQAVAGVLLNPTGAVRQPVIPALPHAGNPGNSGDDTWRLALLAGLGLLMVFCLVVMARSYSRSLPR